MVNGISSTNFGAYIDYLKSENQTIDSSKLSFSLEEYLDEQDAASVINITDTTLKAAGEDTVRTNADKLVAFGVDEYKINQIFNSSSNDNSDESNVSNITGISALKEERSKALSENKKAIDETTKINEKNVNARNTLQTKITLAKNKNEALLAQYKTLQEEATAEQDAKMQANTEENNDYEQKVVGKLDGAAAMQTEKYQQLENNTQEVTKKNDNTEGVKIDSTNKFNTVNISINTSTDMYDNSTGYNLAGVNLFETGIEVINTGDPINGRAISIAETGWNQLQAANAIAAGNTEQQAAKDAKIAAAQAIYDRGVALANDSFDTMSMGRENLNDSHKYYEQSNKFVASGNMFISKTTTDLTNINNSNTDLADKIQELQSHNTAA